MEIMEVFAIELTLQQAKRGEVGGPDESAARAALPAASLFSNFEKSEALPGLLVILCSRVALLYHCCSQLIDASAGAS